MKVFHELPSRDAQYDVHKALAGTCVVAVGFFDGFHRGHRAIIRELLRIRRPTERAVVLTFRNHPATYLRSGNEPAMIMTVEERINSIARAGVDIAYIVPFDASIATLLPDAFLDQTLVELIGARAMVVGENFRFGAKRSGDVAFAKAHLYDRGLDFVAVPNEIDEGERISSTRIREAIMRADCATADRLLGSAYAVRGLVAMGFGRGHDLGFPTANITVAPEKMLPPDGVYAISARHDGRTYAGLVSIGTNPTFNGTRRTVEAWLRDFTGSLYGEELILRDFHFLRPQQRFESVDALLNQMRADAATVRFPSFQ